MKLRQRILDQMVETKEDKVVRELRGSKGFNEDFIRKRFRNLNQGGTKNE